MNGKEGEGEKAMGDNGRMGPVNDGVKDGEHGLRGVCGGSQVGARGNGYLCDDVEGTGCHVSCQAPSCKLALEDEMLGKQGNGIHNSQLITSIKNSKSFTTSFH